MKYTRGVIYVLLFSLPILLIGCFPPIFAMKSKTDTTPETTIKNQIVLIDGVPFFCKDAKDAQEKADALFKLYTETEWDDPAAAVAARQGASSMIQSGYVSPEHRSANTPVASTVFNADPITSNTGNFGPAITSILPGKSINLGDTDVAKGIGNSAIGIATTKLIVDAANKQAVASGALPQVSQAALSDVAKLTGKINTVATAVDISTAGLAYIQANEAFIKSGQPAADPKTGTPNLLYVDASNKLMDLAAAVAPVYYTPVFNIMKDAGQGVATLQIGQSPTTGIGKAEHKVLKLFSNYAITDAEKAAVGLSSNEKVTPPCYGPSAPGCIKRLAIATKCPLNFIVTAPDGKKAGVDPTTKKVVEEIPGSFVLDADNYNVDSQIVYLPALQSGDYQITATGFGKGDYNLYYKTFDADGNVLTSQQSKGKISNGEVLGAKFNPNADSLARDSEKIVFVKDVIYKYILPSAGFVLIVLVVSFLAFRKKRKRL